VCDGFDVFVFVSCLVANDGYKFCPAGTERKAKFQFFKHFFRQWRLRKMVNFKVPLGRKFIGLFPPNSVSEYRVLFIFPQKTEQQTFHPNIF